MDYEYTGPGPHEDPELGLIRPGDVRGFDAEPDFGPWRCIQPGAEEAGEAGGLEVIKAIAASGAVLAAAAATPPPPVLGTLTTPATGTEGM